MSREEIKEKVIELVRYIADDAENIDEESALMDDIGMDSIQVLTLTSLVEKTFNFKFAPRENIGLDTIGDIVEFLVKKNS